MKKEWQKPELEELKLKMTMSGPGKRIEDAWDVDEDPHHVS